MLTTGCSKEEESSVSWKHEACFTSAQSGSFSLYWFNGFVTDLEFDSSRQNKNINPILLLLSCRRSDSTWHQNVFWRQIRSSLL